MKHVQPRNRGRLRATIALLACTVLAACTGAPDGVEPVTDFELDRYLGKWYEIARLDHSFERGLSRVTAEYSLRDDGGVRVVNRGYDAAKGEWDEAVGKAYFTGEADVGQLKVSFFGPFYGGYNVIDLDRENYRFSLVAGPNRDYLWILAREPGIDEATRERLLTKADAFGFNTGALIWVEQGAVSEGG